MSREFRRIASGGNPFHDDEPQYYDEHNKDTFSSDAADALNDETIQENSTTSKVEYHFPGEPLFPSIDVLSSGSNLKNSTKVKAILGSTATFTEKEDVNYDQELLRAQIDLTKSQDKRISIEIQQLEAQEKRIHWTWRYEGLKMMLQQESIDEDTRKLLQDKVRQLSLELLND